MWDGCRELLDEGSAVRCLVDTAGQTLTLWADGRTATVHFAPEGGGDERPLAAVATMPAAGGTRLVVSELKGAAGTLIVRSGGREETLAVGPWSDTCGVRAVRRLINTEPLTDHLKRLDGRVESATSSCRPLMLSRRARALARAGRTADATADYRTALAAHRDAGHLQSATMDAFQLARLRWNDAGAFTEARALIEEARSSLQRDHYARAYGAINLAMIDARLAYVASAQELIAESTLAEQRIDGALTPSTRAMVMFALGRLERHAELDAHLAPLLTDKSATARQRSNALLTVAWSELKRGWPWRAAFLVPDRTRVGELVAAMTAAAAEAERPRHVRLATLNAALSALQANDPTLAQGLLEGLAAPAQGDQVDAQAWHDELVARTQLASGDVRGALERASSALQLARDIGDDQATHRAYVLRARAQLQSGETAAGLASLDAAEALAANNALALSMSDDIAPLLARHEEPTRLRIDALMASNDAAGAMLAAREARARYTKRLLVRERLGALTEEARTQWETHLQSLYLLAVKSSNLIAKRRFADQASAGALTRELAATRKLERETRAKTLAMLGSEPTPVLRSPVAGEVLLTYFPGETHWWGFAWREGAEPVGARIAAVTDDAIGAETSVLLRPFTRELAAATRVTVLPYGTLRSVDFAALTVKGRALYASHDLAYGVDVGRAPAQGAPTLSNARVILATAGPQLAHAERSAAASVGSLTARGIAALTEPGKLATLRSALSKTDYLEYVGHAARDAGEGFGSRLELDDGAFDIGDVLMSPRVPPSIALFACSTSRQRASIALADIGVGEAFVVAGAQTVLAARDAVDDRATATLSSHIHRALARGETMARALRHAQAELSGSAQFDEAMKWRVLTP